MDEIDFSRWLQDRLAEKGWTKAELSRRSGVSAPRVLLDMDMTRVAQAINAKLESAPPEELGQVLRDFVVSITASKPQRQALTGSITYGLPGVGDSETYAMPL